MTELSVFSSQIFSILFVFESLERRAALYHYASTLLKLTSYSMMRRFVEEMVGSKKKINLDQAAVSQWSLVSGKEGEYYTALLNTLLREVGTNFDAISLTIIKSLTACQNICWPCHASVGRLVSHTDDNTKTNLSGAQLYLLLSLPLIKCSGTGMTLSGNV